MSIEESYLRVSSFFDLWVRVMEYRTRLMEIKDSRIGRSKILIISPPTDRGIRLFAGANADGESHLLCFSEGLARIAERYCEKHAMRSMETRTARFFSIPAENGFYDAVYANCFFDFCRDEEIAVALQDVRRVLRPGGHMFAVFMDSPKTWIGRVWAGLFKRFPSLTGGCRPVTLAQQLSQSGLVLKEDIALTRFGFPIRYVVGER